MNYDEIRKIAEEIDNHKGATFYSNWDHQLANAVLDLLKEKKLLRAVADAANAEPISWNEDRCNYAEYVQREQSWTALLAALAALDAHDKSKGDAK